MRRATLWVLFLLILAAIAWLVLRDRDAAPAGTAPPDTVPAKGAEAARPTTPPVLKGQGEAPTGDGEATSNASESPSGVVDGLRVVGRVVTDLRRPVAGAVVATYTADGVVDRATTDAEGRFEIVAGPRPETQAWPWLTVRADEGGARRMLYLTPDSRAVLDIGAIVLQASHALTLRVTRDGAAVAGAQVVVLDAEHQGPGAKLASGRTDDAGLLVLPRLAATKVHAFACAEGSGRVHAECALPRGDRPLDLPLPPDRTVTVHVLAAKTAEPVANAEVVVSGAGVIPYPRGPGCLPPLPALRTDATGRVVVAGLPAGHLSVVARAPGLALPSNGLWPERVGVAPDETEVTLHLQPYRTLRFPILDGEHPVPADGTILGLRRYQETHGYDEAGTGARVEDGHVLIEPFPPGHDQGHVTTPDGRWAAWRTKYQSDLGDGIVFHAARDVDLRLAWSDGTPAAGEWITLLIRPRGRRYPTRTDEDGRLVFPACIGKTAIVLWTPSAQGFGTPLATVDLLSPPAPTAITLDRTIDIAIRITVNGVARLPAAYHVRVPSTDPVRRGRPRSIGSNEYEEDVDEAEVRFRWLRQAWDETLSVTVGVDGYPDATAHLVEGEDHVWRGTAEILASTSLHVRVVAPEDGRYWLRVERWLDDRRTWHWDHRDAAMRAGQKAEDGIHRYVGLPPGRYRLMEHYTGTLSNPFDLVTGGKTLEIPFDLSSMVVVEGRVVVPDGYEPGLATVGVNVGMGSEEGPGSGIRMDAEGRFQHRALRGQRLRFTVSHPALRPATEGGTVEVVAGGEAPVLRLESAEQIVFRVEGLHYTTPAPDPRVSTMGSSGPLHVQLAPAGSEAADAPFLTPVARDGVFRLAVPHAGVWDVRIVMHGRVPVFRRGVEVSGIETDLGTLTLSKGATLTIRLTSASGKIPPFLRVRATSKGDPSYVASGFRVEQGDPPVVRVPGLGPGRFRLHVAGGPGFTETIPDRDIESDGSTPVAIDLSIP